MNSLYTSLLKKIKTKQAKIGVIGLGYVGLPLAILFAKKGFLTTGFVRSKEKQAMLSSAKSYIKDDDIIRDLSKVLKKKKFIVKITNSSDLQKQEILVVCVPTPVTQNKKPDLADFLNVAKQFSAVDLIGKLIINESTVAPYTTRKMLGNFKSQYFLACSPERVDPGNKNKTTRNIPKVVGGISNESLKLAQELYKRVLNAEIVEVSSLESAEMAKMLENTYRAVNIALINEFAKLAEKLNIDILEVINAAKTKWTFQAHYPSIGVGGHCIPVDPYYILELAEKMNVSMKVVLDSLLENEYMPNYVLEKLLSVYKKGKKVLVYGLTYKKDVGDVRESPVILFCKLLKEKKIPFSVYDPFVSKSDIQKWGLSFGELEKSDILVVGTAHSALANDYKKIIEEYTIVIDGQNFFGKKVGKIVIGLGRNFV